MDEKERLRRIRDLAHNLNMCSSDRQRAYGMSVIFWLSDPATSWPDIDVNKRVFALESIPGCTPPKRGTCEEERGHWPGL